MRVSGEERGGVGWTDTDGGEGGELMMAARLLSPTAGYGVTTDGQTVFINASSCNFYYRPVNPPIVFDLPNAELPNT